MKGWGTPPEIALYVGRPLKTVRNWASLGHIPVACRRRDKALVIHAESARRHSEQRASRKRGLRASA